jgi:uncharacterized protein (TIGR00255 family)
MNSMTGFGRGTATLGTVAVAARVTSVNRKGLDLKISLPEAWAELEAPLAEEVRKVVFRGAVQLRVELENAAATGSGASTSELDVAAAEDYLERVETVAARRGLSGRPSADGLATLLTQFRRRPEPPAPAEAQPAVLAAVRVALAGLVTMRATEGTALRADLAARLALLRVHVDAIAARAPQVVVTARESLLKRLREAGLDLRVDDERVLKEIALFADRCDIAEELTRFRSHHAQLAALLAASGEIGRKAEFILQEMGREVNTTGAKANDYEIARLVIELKNELERLKEQVANVE